MIKKLSIHFIAFTFVWALFVPVAVMQFDQNSGLHTVEASHCPGWNHSPAEAGQPCSNAPNASTGGSGGTSGGAGGGSGTGGTSGGAGGSAQLQNPLKFATLTGVLLAIVDVLLTLAVPVVIFFIVYAGFLYVTAQGNATKIQDANRALMYAIIGGVIVFGARVIGAVIQNTVGSITIP